MKIENVAVYGYEQSIVASGLPKTDLTGQAQYDMKRARNLGGAKTGSGHDCFLKGIIVQFDMTFSQVMMGQIERYHFIDIISSQSKMHKITTVKKENFNEYVDEMMLQRYMTLVDYYNQVLIHKGDTKEKKEYLKKLIYSCPCGLELTARFTTNYLQLKTIIGQREHHFLDNEWGVFCKWVRTLPEFSNLCLRGE